MEVLNLLEKQMTKDDYIKKLVIEDKKRLQEKLTKIKRMDESDAQATLLAQVEQEIQINESIA